MTSGSLRNCSRCGRRFSVTLWQMHAHNPERLSCSEAACGEGAVGHCADDPLQQGLGPLCGVHLVEHRRWGHDVRFVDGGVCTLCDGRRRVPDAEDPGGRWVECSGAREPDMRRSRSSPRRAAELRNVRGSVLRRRKKPAVARRRPRSGRRVSRTTLATRRQGESRLRMPARGRPSPSARGRSSGMRWGNVPGTNEAERRSSTSRELGQRGRPTLDQTHRARRARPSRGVARETVNASTSLGRRGARGDGRPTSTGAAASCSWYRSSQGSPWAPTTTGRAPARLRRPNRHPLRRRRRASHPKQRRHRHLRHCPFPLRRRRRSHAQTRLPRRRRLSRPHPRRRRRPNGRRSRSRTPGAIGHVGGTGRRWTPSSRRALAYSMRGWTI